MAAPNAPPETKRRPGVSRISKQVYLFIIVLLLACLFVFIVPSSPAPDVGMKVSLFSALTGGLLASVGTQAANGPDSDGTLDLNSGEANGRPTVRTSSGLIVGHNAPNRPGVGEFLGIRFARPPVGELRFAAPKAYTSRDTFVASHFVR